MSGSKLQQVMEALGEMMDDSTVPKNVKSKISTTLSILKQDSEISIKISKALDQLDELTDDTNIESYTRTQLWNIVSMLEMI